MLMVNTEIILATITIVISSIFSSDNTFITSLRYTLFVNNNKETVSDCTVTLLL